MLAKRIRETFNKQPWADFVFPDTGLVFYAPLRGSIALSRGTGTPSFTRATVATVNDHEGKVRNVLSGEARFTGARRERNIVDATMPTESWNVATAVTTSRWFLVATEGSTATGFTDPNGGTAALQIVFNGGPNNTFAGRVAITRQRIFRWTVWIRTTNGTLQTRLSCTDTVAWASSTISPTLVLDTTWRRYSLLIDGTGFAAGTNVDFNIGAEGKEGFIQPAGTIQIAFPMIQDVTGRANQNPSEYVSVGVLASPFHGAGVDGVKYFEFENGNTVAANVVTGAVGASIPVATLKGYLSEGASSLALAAVATGPFAAGYTAVSTPTRVADAVRVGDFTLDEIGDDDAATLEGYTRVVAFTGDGQKSISVLWNPGTSTSTVVRVRDTTAVADRLLVAITHSSGVPTVTATTGTQERAPEALGNGVYRLFFLTAAVTALNTNQLEIYPATTAALAVANTGTVRLGGVQAENALFASSIATAARNADVLTYTGTGINIAASGATVYCEDYRYNASGSAHLSVSVNDGTVNERVQLYVSAASGHVATVVDGGLLEANIIGGAHAINTAYKRAARFAVNNVASYVNATQIGTDALATMPTTNQVHVGHELAAFAANGNVRDVRIWNRSLNDLTLQVMTR